MRRRVEQLPVDPHRDRLLAERIDALQQAWQHRIDALAPGQPPTDDLVRARWLLEEFRVSLWAQQLGTAETVSDQRIRKLLGA
jgi:ATP-dependent helicase HrpA